MTRIMYDSTTIADLPPDTKMAMGYVDGRQTHNNFNELLARFPKIKTVKCTVTGETLSAQVGDIEHGDMTIQSGCAWAKRKVESLHTPTLYFSLAVLDDVKSELAKLGIIKQTLLFVAHYDGIAKLPAGFIAKQYAAPQHYSTGHFDISIVADHWPGVDRPKGHK